MYLFCSFVYTKNKKVLFFSEFHCKFVAQKMIFLKIHLTSSLIT